MRNSKLGLSGDKLEFVITSRTGLQDVKPWNAVKLNSLSHEDAKKVLISHVNCDVRKTAHFSYLDIIVELLISIISTYNKIQLSDNCPMPP